MIIDLTKLKNNIVKEIIINNICSFDEYINKNEILELNNVKVEGKIYKDVLDNYILDVNAEGKAVLPCSITLKPVDYKFNIEINENIEEMLKEIEGFEKKLENSIDILPIIWENILMEIPNKVVSEDAKDIKLEGDGWKLITDDKKEDINPAFEKLNELL
jgi:uncharacterized protein